MAALAPDWRRALPAAPAGMRLQTARADRHAAAARSGLRRRARRKGAAGARAGVWREGIWVPRADLPAPAAPAAAGDSGPSLRYLNEFIKLRCAPELLTLRVFPDAKEITEAMSVLSAWRAHILPLAAALPPAAAGERRCIVCVGDGCTPRSAALFRVHDAGLGGDLRRPGDESPSSVD
jgi:hypothetical protein